MDLLDMIEQEIFEFVAKEKIKISDIVLKINGDMGSNKCFKVFGDIEKEKKEKLEKKLRELSTIEEKIKILVKYKYGSFPKMDKMVGISGHRAKFKRWRKNTKKLFNLIDCDICLKHKQ